MKAVITRGKNKGREVIISQWCNDWFTIDSPKKFRLKPFNPSSLAFTISGMWEISDHTNNGTLLEEFKVVPIKNFGKYSLTFRKRSRKEIEEGLKCLESEEETEEGCEPDEDVYNFMRGER